MLHMNLCFLTFVINVPDDGSDESKHVEHFFIVSQVSMKVNTTSIVYFGN
jgi:hypothetical protein